MINRSLKHFIADLRADLMRTGTTSVFYHEAAESSSTSNTYIVFDVTPQGEDRIRIDINIWGHRGNEEGLLDLTDSVEELLDNRYYSAPMYTASVHSDENSQWILDENKDIKRRNISFSAIFKS